MAALRPREARYLVLGPGGGAVGHEALAVARDGDGWVFQSRLETAEPWLLVATITWQLDARLGTRVLTIGTINRYGDEHEVELAVTGNGVLAHRRGPDGPSQVELGWGPRVELDYLSAAFSEVTLRRLAARGEPAAEVACVSLDPETLEPAVVERRFRRLASGTWECDVPATGYHARLEVDEEGALVEHEGLFLLETPASG